VTDPPPGLADQLVALADDELVLGHRDSEWTGHAPILEEDIAFANIAQDEIGHALLWYGLVHALIGDTPDQLVFLRGPAAYRNVQLVELPKGDWAFSMLRQYLFDAAESARLAQMVASRYAPMAQVAAKIRTEEIYHYRHTHGWARRLALGTDESHRRMQTALDQAWPYAQQLFVPLPDEGMLVEAGIVPAAETVRQAWVDLTSPLLLEAGLAIPNGAQTIVRDRHTHTQHLERLLADMQEVARSEGPEVGW
jgi:ring-1,2-phenylacetyl-CoA epoxidase subunit PaaC